ncbi:MAG: caspase family protein [Alphaproteobacteria bacterium]|nr:caspase family protein [Alphaproteobacteria bacterium]
MIRVNHYQDARYDLDYGASDALSILLRFDQASTGLFNRTVAYQLADETATRAKIIEVFTALQLVAPEDVLVIYLAGHGVIIGNEWYWLPVEATFTADGVPRTGISATMVRDLLSRVGPERVFVMIDSCNSGGSVDPLATSMDRRVLRSVGRDTGVSILAAAPPDQSAAELPRLGHGAFTYVVLEGLNQEG